MQPRLGPTTPVNVAWNRFVEKITGIYRGIMPDATSDWATEKFTKDLVQEGTIKWGVSVEYVDAVYRPEEKAEGVQE
jgi:hypothetical protein